MIEAVAPAGTNSAPNNEPPPPAEASARMREFRKEIHKPEAEYNANVPVDEIEPDPRNRDKIDQTAIAALADSIKEDGLLQPVVLRLLKPGHYRLIAGERRWRAHKLLKRPTIAARIYRTEDDLSAARKKVAENRQRENLTPIEDAKRMKELGELGMKQADIGKLLGRSQPAVANALRMLELPAGVQGLIAEGRLTAAHGVNLCRFSGRPALAEAIAKIAIEEEVPAKELAKGLPFAWKLERQGLVVDLGWHAPDRLAKDPDCMLTEDDCGGLYCLDVGRGKKLLAELEAKEKERDNQQSGRTADGKMTEAAKKERARTIASNKRNRLATKATFAAAIARLSGVDAVDLPALCVVAATALNAGHHASRITDAARGVGVELPKGLVTSSWYSAISLEKLKAMKPADIIRVAAAAILATAAHEADRAASECPKTIQLCAPKGALVNGDAAAAAPSEGKSKRAAITDAIRAQVRDLHRAGHTGAEIAKAVKISLPSVQNIKKALGLVRAK